MPDKGGNENAPPTDHGEIYSSDAPGGTYNSGTYDPNTGHQTQFDREEHRHVSRDWTNGEAGKWHPTDQTKNKTDPDRHKPWWK